MATPFALEHVARTPLAALALRPGETLALAYGHGHRRREALLASPSPAPSCPN